MSSIVPKLSIRVSNAKGKKTYHFETKEIIVGRSKEATLRIPVNGISRAHFQITALEDSLMITDLGSANGTLLNEERLYEDTPQPFYEGDIISIPGLDVKFMCMFEYEEEKTEKSLIGFLFSGKEKNTTDSTTQVKKIVKKEKGLVESKPQGPLEFQYQEDQEILDKERLDAMQKEIGEENKKEDVDIEFDLDVSNINAKPPEKKKD
jgi:pSer/pThr/pTyr-binding forkhead associated (FHA) protein